MHDSLKKYLLTDTKDDEFGTDINPLEDSPGNMKHVGKSMFIINNGAGDRERSQEEVRMGSSSAFTTTLKDKIQ